MRTEREYANRRGFFPKYENIIAGYVQSEKGLKKVLRIDKRTVTLDKRRSNSSQREILHDFLKPFTDLRSISDLSYILSFTDCLDNSVQIFP